MFGTNMVFTVSSQSNPWVLSWLLGGASVGAYSICESVVNIPRVALTSMQNVMGPMLARAYAEGGKERLGKVVRRMDIALLAGSAIFAVGIVTLGPWVEMTIFKQAPEQSRWILALLSVNLIVFAATLAQSYGLTAMDKAGLTFYANLCGLAVQVAVTVWLVRSMRVPGAAEALLVGSLAVAVVRAYFYAKEIRTA